MRGRKKTLSLTVSQTQRADLQRWLRSTTGPAGRARRGRWLPRVAGGPPPQEAAATVGMTIRNARKWAIRFAGQGLDGLNDLRGRGRPPVFSPRGRAPSG